MKKVVSIALFGNIEKYAPYLRAFVLAHHNIFPERDGWMLFVNTSERTLHEFPLLGGAHGSLIHVTLNASAPLTRAMLWRLKPVFQPVDREPIEPCYSDYVFCRDLDALPTPRDRMCCDQFIASGAVVHTIHDNVMHEGIMGGLCGFDAQAVRKLVPNSETIAKSSGFTDEQWAVHGADQIALNRFFLRRGGPKLFEHRYNGWSHAKPQQMPARAAGRYMCPAISAPIPDSDDVRDTLVNHMGSAGYDHRAAEEYYITHGDPEVARRVREWWP